MCHPADDTRSSEQRRIQRLGQSEHFVNKAGIHIDVCTHRLVAALDLGKDARRQLFYQLDQIHLVRIAGLFRQRTSSLFQCNGTRVAQGVNCMTHAVDQAGAVACFLIQNLAQIIADLGLVLPVVDILLHLLKLLDDAQVCTAVARALQ